VISLRYHIVSLVAVFLALALGIVVGSTVLREGTVSVLRATGEQVRQSNESYRQENLALKGELARHEEFATTVLPDLVRGRLRDRHVVVLDTDRVDGGVRDQVIQVLGAAGAEVDGRVTFNAGRLALATQEDTQALGRLLPGANAADPGALRTELIRRVAERLGSSDPLPTEDPDRRNDLLTSLDDGGFLADLKLAPSVADGRVPFPAPGSVVVVLGPSDGALPPEAFLVPLADQLSLHVDGPVAGVEALAAGTTPGTTSWIAKLREDSRLARRVSGIDDVDTAYGQLALVGAVERGLLKLASGQYGFKAGNSGLLPEKVPAS
jgi:Copper transport outer membrane protein, MctB